MRTFDGAGAESTAAGFDVIHKLDYGLAGHLTDGVWRGALYSLEDGLEVAELDPSASWKELVQRAADWVTRDHTPHFDG